LKASLTLSSTLTMATFGPMYVTCYSGFCDA
jgi:hypothetical protein